MDKPRQIYKRAGIIHICYSGSLWAPALVEGERPSTYNKGDRVRVLFERDDESLVVSSDEGTPEPWVRVDIPRGAPRAPGNSPRSSDDDYRVFLPRGFEHPMGAPTYGTLALAEEACARAIRELGITRESWAAAGWGTIYERSGLTPVKHVEWAG